MDKKELRKQVKVLKSQYSLEQKVEMSRPLWKELEQTDFFQGGPDRVALLVDGRRGVHA